MPFPIAVESSVNSHNGTFTRIIHVNSGLTILLGPNGSGKTHLLRGLIGSIGAHAAGRKVRFMSSGRMGLIERYRSNYDGQRGSVPAYDQVSYGAKGDVGRRHQTETLTGDFQTLSERADILIKVQERIRKLFRRDVFLEWDAGHLKVQFNRIESGSNPYPSSREASGLVQLVGILSALYDDEVGALLIDEPEVSLHPQLQAFLLKEVLSVAGDPSVDRLKKLVVMATHSTEMLPINSITDLSSIVFCGDLSADPTQLSPGAPEIKNKKLQALVTRLGQEHKLSLFCSRPLLVEGSSDSIICNALAQNLGTHLEAAGSQILPVQGKGQMAIVSKLFRLLGKQAIALVDADALADSTEVAHEFVVSSPEAERRAVEAGFKSADALVGSVMGDFYQLVDAKWDSIEPIAKKHPYWTQRESGDETLAKRRAAFCALFGNDDELKGPKPDSMWTDIRSRIVSVLSLLEVAGLFVLSKGTIESYFESPDFETAIGKPSVAVEEAARILASDERSARERYLVVVRCLDAAANTEAIREAEALRDLLLSVCAPAHAKLKSGESFDLNVLARSLIGERSRIFDLAVDAGSLVISIRSAILNIDNFPLRISASENPSDAIAKALAIE